MTTEAQQEIVKIFVQNPGMTPHRIAMLIGETDEAVQSMFDVLVNYGIVESKSDSPHRYRANLGTNYLNEFYVKGITSRYLAWPSDIVNVATMALDAVIVENWQQGRHVPGIRDLKERFLMYSRDGFAEVNVCAIEMATLCMALLHLAEYLPDDLKLGRAYPLLIISEIHQ